MSGETELGGLYQSMRCPQTSHHGNHLHGQTTLTVPPAVYLCLARGRTSPHAHGPHQETSAGEDALVIAHPWQCPVPGDAHKAVSAADIQEEHAHPSWVGAARPPLLLVLHVTPIGGVLASKKGLQDRLNLLLKDRTLLIGLHGVERVP